MTPSNKSAPARQEWTKWLLPAVLIVAAAVFFLQKGKETGTAQSTAPAMYQDSTKINPATLEIIANIERLRVALPKVSDPASAQAAVREVREVSSRLAQLKSSAQQLPSEARKSVSDALSTKVTELNLLLERILKEIDYLSGEAKPAIDTLKMELANFSKA
jgi:hypothetical protein